MKPLPTWRSLVNMARYAPVLSLPHPVPWRRVTPRSPPPGVLLGFRSGAVARVSVRLPARGRSMRPARQGRLGPVPRRGSRGGRDTSRASQT